jgi:hypothetical protein
MSRTIKDFPFWLWQAERLGAPYPPTVHGPWGRDSPVGARYLSPAEYDAWYARFPIDPAVRTQKARHRGQRLDRRAQHQRYRAYVRGRIAHGDYDGIEPPEHLPGYLWWW